MDTTGGALAFKSTLDDTDFLRRINNMENRLKNLTDTATAEGAKQDKVFKNLGAGVVGILGLMQLGQFGKQLITVRGQFEKLEVAFKTMLGSEAKAMALMKDVTLMAAQTPYSLEQVATGAKQLLAYNVAQEDIIETLTRLGNVSAGVGVDLTRLITVYGQVKAKGILLTQDMRQFMEAGVPIASELSKVMGVAENAIGKMVEEGQVGFADVARAINSMTDAGGKFYNLMQEQSKTVAGMISNLGDAWERMLNDIGADNEGIIKSGVAGLTELVENYELVVDILKILITTYGGYRAAVALNAIALKFQKIASLEAAQGHGVLTAANTMLIASTEAAKASFNRLTAAMALNPFTIALTAITAITAALFFFRREVEEVATIEERLADASKEIAGGMGEMRGKLEPLIAAVQSHTASEEQRLKAYNKIKEIAPDILKGYTLEEAKIAALAARTKEWYDNYLKIISVNVYKDQLEQAGRALAIAQQELETKQEVKKVEDERIANARKNENDNARGNAQGYKSIGQTVDTKTMQAEVDIAQKAVDTAQEAWDKLQVLVNKTEATLLSVSTTQVEGQRTAAQEILVLQQTIADYEEQLGNLSADRSADVERRKLAKLKEVAEERIKVLRGEYSKRKTVEDATKPFKDELDKIKQAYTDYYAYIKLMGDNADKARFASLTKYGDTYSKYLQNKVAELEAKINTGKFSNLDLTQLSVYKKELADATPQVTPADEIRQRLGDVKEAAAEGKTELEKIKLYIKEIDKLTAEIKGGSGKFKGLNPEERENTLADLARERIDAEKQAARAETDRVYALSQEYMSYQQEKVKITEDATEDVLLLIKHGYTEQAEERRKQYRQDIAELETHNAEVLKEFEVLKIDLAVASADVVRTAIEMVEQIDISKLTEDKAQEVKDSIVKLKGQLGKINFFDFKLIKQLKKEMEDTSLTDEQRLKASAQLTEAVDEKTRQAISGMQQFAQAIAGANEELGNALNTLSNIAAGAAMMASGDYLGGGLAIVSSLISEISKDGGTAQEKQAAAADRLGRTLERLNLVLEQQERLIAQAFGIDKIAAFDNGITIMRGNINELIADINSMIPTFNESVDWMARYTQAGNEAGGVQAYIDKYGLKPIDIPELTSEMNIVELNAALAALQQQANAIEAIVNEFGAAPDVIEEQLQKDIEAINTYTVELQELIEQQTLLLTGTTTDSVANAIIQGFAQGYSSAADFADTFEDLMKQAILNSLKLTYLEPALKQWMALFSEYMADTELTDEERDILQKEWDNIIARGKTQLDALNQMLDLDFGDSSTNELEGAIRGMSEETAGVIAGQMNAIRMSITSVIDTMQSMLAAQQETAINSRWLKEIYNKLSSGGTDPLAGEGITF